MASKIDLSPAEYKTMSVQHGSLSEWEDVVKEESEGSASLRGPVFAGLATLVIGIGGFLTWAAVTPVAQASVASGKVIVESNTKTVTHLEGGTLKELLVNEGQRVQQGSLLATLDVTRSQAAVLLLRQQLFVQHIKLGRLIAERDEEKNFDFDGSPPLGMDEEMAAHLVKTERKLFSERVAQFSDLIATDRSLISQLQSQRQALQSRRKALAEQLKLMRDDFDVLVKLEKRKLETRMKISEKHIELVDVEARIAEIDASLSENVQKARQAELTLSNHRTEYFRVISEQIQLAQSEIARLRQEIVSAEDIVAKSKIRSPQEGIVSNIRLRTPGSALVGGQPLLDVVPLNQPMLIEGKARAMDIDSIRIGEKAEIKLTSFGAAEAFPLVGRVTYIAPDAVLDERTGDIQYVFRAKIDDAELKKQPNLFLYPGMTAEVHIVNGERTALAYLTLPMLQSFNRAFREQ